MHYTAIKFGTDGWRGHIADDFTFDNVALVGSAIAQYLRETGYADKPLLLGYDRRFAAENYAAHLASHLTAGGQPVLLSADPAPTPVVAYGVQKLQAAGAIMLTASHNPYHYQGLKFIPWFAGPALPETTDRITDIVKEMQPSFQAPALRLEWDGDRVSLQEAYFQRLDEILNNSVLATSGIKVLYTAMHGCGAGYLDAYLTRCGVEVVSIATERDVYFGGTLPDPSPRNLTPLADRAAALGCQLVIGTDGDADRFGIVDQHGNYFGANQALALLGDYLITEKGMSGALVRTVGSSQLVDGVAKLHGLPLIETKVGFKYLGAELRKGALIAGEESGGLSFQGHIPEKDGLLSSLMLLEAMAVRGLDLQTMLEDLMQRVGPRYFRRVDVHLPDDQKQTLLGVLLGWQEPTFGGRELERIDRTDGVLFQFKDGCWVMYRASGTEPVVRMYFEVLDKSELDAAQEALSGEMLRLAGGPA